MLHLVQLDHSYCPETISVMTAAFPEPLSAFKWNACPPSPEYPAAGMGENKLPSPDVEAPIQ
jgi:hypothetical protein